MLLVESLLFMILWGEGIIQAKNHSLVRWLPLTFASCTAAEAYTGAAG
jgi:hypothetical protein